MMTKRPSCRFGRFFFLVVVWHFTATVKSNATRDRNTYIRLDPEGPWELALHIQHSTLGRVRLGDSRTSYVGCVRSGNNLALMTHPQSKCSKEGISKPTTVRRALFWQRQKIHICAY